MDGILLFIRTLLGGFMITRSKKSPINLAGLHQLSSLLCLQPSNRYIYPLLPSSFHLPGLLSNQSMNEITNEEE